MSAASTTARAAPAPLHSRADYSLQCVSNMNSAALPSSSPPAPRRRSSTPTTSPSPSPPKSQSQSYRHPHPHHDQRVPASSPTKQPRAIPPPTMDSEMTNANNFNDQQNQHYDDHMPHQQHPQQHDASNNNNGLRKELDMRLAAYLPAVVRRHLEQQDTLRVPDTHETTVVSMFADVSGFTAMTESLAARGPVGAEFLGRYLNSYFEQLLRLVSSAGGDVFKFAGDAMLIFWPENKDDTLESLLRRAVQCALRIQSHLHKAEFATGVVLSVKMGIGIGGATIAHLGGVSDGAIDRMEYIAVGPALEQAFSAEHQAEAGQVICSPQCWKMVGKYFDGEPVRLGSPFQKVTAVNLPIKLVSRRASFTRDDPQLQVRMKQYVSRAVWPYLDAHDEFWGSELRDVTVLFINVGFSEDDLAKMLDVRGLQRLQDAFQIVQKCIYEYEGTINKFLVDDKGSTVIAAFGLPPVTHENDPIRGILSSLAICAALGNMGLKASVGITTGVALCGVVGHQGNRREYTVLGDIVNLSARLMQKAKSENGGVITDETTKLYTHDVLHFEKRPEIFVKGKNDSIQIHRPYPRMSILSEYHSASTRATGARKNAMTLSLPLSPRAATAASNNVGGAVPTTQIQNVMESMHRVQVRDAQRRISLRAEEKAVNAPAIIESDSFLKIRDTLLQACSQLNRFSNGGSFILEGDIGVGKTVLLRTALLSASPEIGCYNVCMGTASPFATRKPYAVWADIISKCALEGYMDSSASSSGGGLTGEAGGATMHSMQMNDFSKEAERRRRVATYVRRKIRDGAAPNTTLVRYAYLLNNILDTNFEEFIDEEPASNNDDEPAHSFGSSATTRSHDAATDVTSPSKMHVKEEDIAAWFLGLLEMDLACSRRNSEDCMASMEPGSARRSPARHADGTRDGAAGHLRAAVSSSASSSASSSSDEATNAGPFKQQQHQQRESEWKPTELDTSGILLLCALHAMSRDKVTVFCLDNAMFMDEKSWVLTTIIAKYFTNCMVIVSTRPPSLSLAEHTQSSSFRKRLRVLKRMQPSVSVAMEPLAPTETHQLALQILKVQVIPSELVTILISRSQGNPLFLHEIIGEMLQQQVIKKDESRYRCYLQVQEAWGDKSKAPSCFYCYIKFNTPKEKFRCESCGYVFCSACTPAACRKKLPGSTGDPVRHCSNCYSSPAATAIAAGTVASGRGFGKSKQKLQKQPAVQSSLEDRIALRPPKTVKSVLTTLLDQLSVSQRMIMKTASVVGSVFEEELLRGTSPIKAHLGQFQQDLEDLERLAMIRRIDTFIAGLKKVSTAPSLSEVGSTTMTTPRPPSLKVKYEFCHGFMQDVIRSQLLGSQLAKLKARCDDCREHQEKMVRQCFIERVKAVQGSGPAASSARRGSNPHNVPLPASSARRRSLTSIGDEYDGGESRRGSSQLHDGSGRRASARASSSASRDDSVLNLVPLSLSQQQQQQQRTVNTAPAYIRLKTGAVFVKKQSSLFSHLKFKGLTNARLWKKRFAVLHNSRLTLQYDEVSGSKPRQGTSLFLRGAKVSACDPEVASKVNCFQVEVNEWTKGKYLMNQKRFFVMGVQSEAEVENWVYMIRYAIESLENNCQ